MASSESPNKAAKQYSNRILWKIYSLRTAALLAIASKGALSLSLTYTQPRYSKGMSKQAQVVLIDSKRFECSVALKNK